MLCRLIMPLSDAKQKKENLLIRKNSYQYKNSDRISEVLLNYNLQRSMLSIGFLT